MDQRSLNSLPRPRRVGSTAIGETIPMSTPVPAAFAGIITSAEERTNSHSVRIGFTLPAGVELDEGVQAYLEAVLKGMAMTIHGALVRDYNLRNISISGDLVVAATKED